jgi:hypothetical protein
VAAETATIRVTRRTRDLLAGQARERGVSIAFLLAELARERETEAVWRSERRATRADSKNLAVTAEEHMWEAALADGLD